MFTAPFACLRVVAVGEDSAKVYGGFQIANDDGTLKLFAERDVTEDDNSASDNKFEVNEIEVKGGEEFSFNVTISLTDDGKLQSVTNGSFGEYKDLSYTLTGKGDNITAIASLFLLSLIAKVIIVAITKIKFTIFCNVGGILIFVEKKLKLYSIFPVPCKAFAFL